MDARLLPELTFLLSHLLVLGPCLCLCLPRLTFLIAPSGLLFPCFLLFRLLRPLLRELLRLLVRRLLCLARFLGPRLQLHLLLLPCRAHLH
ncbi:hypothetical protein K438DRAFT_1882691 [Mycena galopus ATCC 62051]|nr:hypothetical protein K438DRAFT_1882691 [Mycena galopus ATCC 62051]